MTTPVLRKNSIRWFSTRCNIVTFCPPGPRALSFIFLNVTDFKGVQAGWIRSDDLKESSRVYISHLRNGQWSEAELVPAPVSLPGALQFGVSLSRDQKRLYFSTNRKGGMEGLIATTATERETSGENL